MDKKEGIITSAYECLEVFDKSLYSKVVIRPTESLSGLSDRRQKQIQFRYDNERGALFAGNNNILL